MLPETLSRRSVVLLFVAAAALALPFADIAPAGHDPWAVLGRMARGALSPDFGAVDRIGRALWLTVTFAIAGVAAGAAAGFVLAPFYGARPVRALCIALRSVHELFWALLLMQVLGISAATGVLAIALPYAGIFAKVFSEQMDEADPAPLAALPPGTDALSRFLYARLPVIRGQMWTYTIYRLECGMRSSAVLGFVGLPTLGFQLDGFFKLGDYGAASAILILYVLLIASLRHWMRPRLVLPWIAAALVSVLMVRSPPMGSGALWRFLSQDIVPAPLRRGEGAGAVWDWLQPLLTGQALPGLIATLIVGQIALVLTGALAFAASGPLVPRVSGRIGAAATHLVLVILRSLPEYMLAYLFLQVFGPSMLPAILALALHNGAIIGHLTGREGAALVPGLRRDAPRGLSLWGYELAPRLFGPFLALCLYRWEIILRETAVMGLLGVATLGFFVDMAVAELRMDRVLVLLVATGLMTSAVDALSRALRRRVGRAPLRSGAEGRGGAAVEMAADRTA
ncbi:PhnE/PtxC family ABC transporter permease [Wenxinia saemankumensis]|uniref:Phosphonate transport system permease protein n=1 Tax=Wenxinia saemankumensis TaxID=1447782 RepID=A0A1M6ACR3_9RHOB|nr:ABC transporter permease [Wenxinia saemankumensis]SHI34276.1 phosphonate transport system permease protein [Wenxinia saemankumensis]